MLDLFDSGNRQGVAPLAGSVDRNGWGGYGNFGGGKSLPSRGAWIEIFMHLVYKLAKDRSLPSRGAWIEILQTFLESCGTMSLPSRGAWIEIVRCRFASSKKAVVAPLAGSVDRNRCPPPGAGRCGPVAPLAGSVDRNSLAPLSSSASLVAPLAGSVDRNLLDDRGFPGPLCRSPRGERG